VVRLSGQSTSELRLSAVSVFGVPNRSLQRTVKKLRFLFRFSRARCPRASVRDGKHHGLRLALRAAQFTQVRAFSLARAFAVASCACIASARAVCMCAAVSPCESNPVRFSGHYFMLFGIFALTGRSSGTRRNSRFESPREFVHHCGSVRCRRAP
jgi:hypothetical protein